MKYYDIFAKYIDNIVPDKNEQLVRCIFHDDTNPSLSINIEKGLFYCHACRIGGDINEFLRLVGEKLDVEYLQSDVNRFHESLLQNSRLLSFLINVRHISLDVIKQYKIGYDSITGRYTIPVTDFEGRIIGLRKYKQYATANKIIAYGESFLCFPFDIINKNETIVITEGELDCLALISSGIPAITLLPPAAISNIDSLAEYIKDKIIIVVYDSDSTGRRLSIDLVRKILHFNDKVKRIDLSPYKDVNDFLSNKSSDELIKIIYESKYYGYTDDDVDIPYIPVSDVLSVQNINKKMKTDFYVASRSLSCYSVPYKYSIVCPANFDFCEKCMLKSYGGVFEDKIKKTFISIIEKGERFFESEVKKYYGIPTRCRYFKIEPIETRLATIVQASNKVEEIAKVSEVFTQIKTYMLTDRNIVEVNSSYSSIVDLIPSLDSNELIIIANNCERINQFVNYELLPSMFQFSVGDNETVFEKMLDIAKDLEYITAINQRLPLIMSLDLVFHSVLNIQFYRKNIKGYLDVLIVGDTRTGKSTVAKELIKFYRLGEIIDGSTTSVAGLIGGISSINDSAFLSWGALPRNDGRLVVIDEAGELSNDILEKLTYIRGSGIAELTKIQTSKTNARVRLIMITNPVSGLKMKDYTYPILSIKEFAKNREDIARFDYCVVVSHDVDTIKVEERGIKYDIDAYFNLVRFAWNIKPNDIIYSFDFDDLLKECDSISNDYSDDIPLIERNSLYEKVLRIAVASAVRTFNYDDKSQKIVVNKEHLKFVRDFLYFIYSDENNKYYQYSQHIKQEEKSFDMNDLIAALSMISKPDRFFDKMQFYTVFSKNELMDIVSSVSRDEFDEIFNALIRNNLIRRLSSGYYSKTELYNKIVDKIKEEIRKKE